MTKRQIFLLIIVVVISIGGAGYLGMSGFNPFKNEVEVEEINIPSTISVSVGDIKESIIAPGKLINNQTIYMPTKINTLVEKIFFQPGQSVKKGETIVQLNGEDEAKIKILEAQIKLNNIHANAALNEAEALLKISNAEQDVVDAKYQLFSMNYTPNEATLTSAQSDVTILAKDLEWAEKNYAPYRNKPDTNQNKAQFGSLWAAAQKAYDDAVRTLNFLNGSPSAVTYSKREAELAKAEANFKIAQSEYEKLENGIDPIELEKAQIELSIAKEKYESLQIKAPFDGVVLSLSVQEGELVSEGVKILEFANPHALEVLISIIEEDYPLLKVGQSVELYFDAVPENESLGKVSRIIPKRSSSSQPLYETYISIENISETLVEGMTADAGIILSEKTDVLRLPRALVHANSDNTATVQVWIEDHLEMREIKTGIRGDVYIEIISGLSEGDLVVSK